MSAGLQKKPLLVGGIPVQIYSDPVADEAQLPVLLVFVLHQRYGDSNSQAIIALIDKLFEEVRQKRKAGEKPLHQLLVVTTDQHNHGWRLVSTKANDAWHTDPAKDNETHAIDMFAIQIGTARDVSFLIDFLPAYLFPNGENHVVSWGAIGYSLGGHVVWTLLREEPRISIGIPIVGCPDYEALMELRAKQTYGVPELKPPRYPDALREIVTKGKQVNLTATDASNPFLGKKILVLSGKEDQLVHWSASESFIDAVQVGPEGVKRILLEEGVGHTMSDRARQEAAEFIAQALIAPVN